MQLQKNNKEGLPRWQSNSRNVGNKRRKSCPNILQSLVIKINISFFSDQGTRNITVIDFLPAVKVNPAELTVYVKRLSDDSWSDSLAT